MLDRQEVRSRCEGIARSRCEGIDSPLSHQGKFKGQQFITPPVEGCCFSTSRSMLPTFTIIRRTHVYGVYFVFYEENKR